MVGGGAVWRTGGWSGEERLWAGEGLIPGSKANGGLANARTRERQLRRRGRGEWEEACRAGKHDLALSMIQRLVPEFGAQEERSALSG